jgi:hypothetical protein
MKWKAHTIFVEVYTTIKAGQKRKMKISNAIAGFGHSPSCRSGSHYKDCNARDEVLLPPEVTKRKFALKMFLEQNDHLPLYQKKRKQPISCTTCNNTRTLKRKKYH